MHKAPLYFVWKALLDNATNSSLETILLALKSFCVDDGLFSFDNEKSLLLFYNEIIEEISIKFDDVFCYSDSISTLQLINNTSRRFSVFADDRLAEIRENSPINRWKYCPSEKNPADMGTRCVLPKNKSKFLLWSEGPKFMYQSKNFWHQFPPECNLTVSNSTITALCEIKTEFKSEKNKFLAPLTHYYSDYNRLIRATCYILRVF